MQNSFLNNENLSLRDKKVFFHPCSQMKEYENLRDIIPIKTANGIYLEDYNKNRYIDAISSWWVNIFGHNNLKINSAMKKQIDDFSHIIMAGFTHKPIVELSEKLIKIAPNGLNKCFYADNGSSAVELSLKMSFQYFKNKNQTKSIFVSLQNSYHGETLGALGVSGVELYKNIYKEILPKSIQSYAPKDQSDKETLKAIKDLEKIFEKNKNNIVSFIIEPLVQCAGDMQMHSEKFVYQARELCKKYNIIFIADEIAVGFGRTGEMFASLKSNITPDILLLSKAITGGYLPLSVAMITDDLYNAFYDDYENQKSFLHSHSYSGNALAASAALAVLDIFEEEDVLKKNKVKISLLSNLLEQLKSFKNVSNIRQTGFIAAFDFKIKSTPRLSVDFSNYALAKGVLLRPLGNTIYIMPPYIIEEKELRYIFEVIISYIKEKNE